MCKYCRSRNFWTAHIHSTKPNTSFLEARSQGIVLAFDIWSIGDAVALLLWCFGALVRGTTRAHLLRWRIHSIRDSGQSDPMYFFSSGLITYWKLYQEGFAWHVMAAASLPVATQKARRWSRSRLGDLMHFHASTNLAFLINDIILNFNNMTAKVSTERKVFFAEKMACHWGTLFLVGACFTTTISSSHCVYHIILFRCPSLKTILYCFISYLHIAYCQWTSRKITNQVKMAGCCQFMSYGNKRLKDRDV
jgi:hypothetical protein